MRVIAAILLVSSLLPFAALIPGGETDPGARERLLDWLLGTALCLGVGGLVAYLQHLRARRGLARPAAAVATPEPEKPKLLPPVAIALGALLLYALIAQLVLSGRPLLIDEIVQVLQARVYAAGALWETVVEPRVFFSILHVVDLGERVFGQYPAGGPLMLVPGVWIGMEWIVGPITGALSVWLFWLLTRHSDPLASRAWRTATTTLFAIAPFGAFMFASHMNHATTLLWLLVALVGIARATADERARPGYALLAGFGLGVAATIRPLDAVAFALPAAAWLAWRARRSRRDLAALACSGIGVGVPLALLLVVNARTTGSPWLFGYDLLWGAGHGLGFHSSPWGPVHTPARGVELIGLALSRLSTYLFETPFPSVLPAAVGLWLARSLNALDRYLLATAALLLTGYWAYWHDGFYLGPRFVFALLPLLVLWSARAAPLLRDRLGVRSHAWQVVRGAALFGAVYAAVSVLIVRAPSYRNGMTSMRFDVDGAATAAGVRDALVLVQESWGAQLVVRMWERGISRSDAEVFYRGIDACAIELTLQQLVASGATGDAAVERMRPLLADSARLIPSTRSPDFTEKMHPAFQYPPLCEERIADDQRGFLHLAPWRLSRDSNVYARWLPGREDEIAAAFPTRPVYRLRRASAAVDAPLVFEPMTPPTSRE